MPAAAVIPQAAIALRNAENSALNGGASLYSGKGRDDDDSENSNPIANIQSKVKKKTVGVVVTIALILIGGGTFLGMSNSLLAPAIEALFTSATDTQYTSSRLRSLRLLKYQSQGNIVSKNKWTGVTKYNKMSTSFKKRLSKQGIEIDSGRSTITYTPKDGGEAIKIPADEFETIYKDNVELQSAIRSAQRGRVAGFFDNIANFIYSKRLDVSRNLFKDFEQTGDIDTDTANFRNTMSSKFDTSGVADIKGSAKEEVADPETGETTTRDSVTSESETTNKTNLGEATTKANATLKKVSDVASKGTSYICGIMKIISMISVMVAANEIYQSINYFMSITENISKMKAGLGTESAINETLNFFSTPVTGAIVDYNSVTATGSESNVSFNANESEITGSPLEATGVQTILGGATANKKAANNYSLERIINSVTKTFVLSAAAVEGCAVANIASGLISIAVTIVSGGLSKIFSGIFSFVLSASVSIAVSTALAFLIPTIAKKLFTNIFETTVGIEAGELFARGSSAANTRIGRNGSGQSLSSSDVAIAYNKNTQEVLAMDAKIDQYERSPFDISNKNTFLGSIAYSLIPTITSNKTSAISAFIRTTSKSIASLISPVHADGENSSYMTTFGDCPSLEAIGAVGDIYCNPITTTDMSTIDLDPNDDTYQDVIYNGGEQLFDNVKTNLECDDEGNCQIVKKSNLGNYIQYCSGRDSPFGIADQSILENLQTGSGAGTVGGAILNALPIVGDVLQVVNGIEDIKNIEWANGSKCGNTETNKEFWESEGKYYQRYIEDTRILNQMGAYEDGKDPITSFLDEITKDEDNSYTGYLARISGIAKSDVEDCLALIDYYMFINEYDPSSRIAFENIIIGKTGKEVVAQVKSRKVFFKDRELVNNESEPIIDNKVHIAYFNIRDKNYII